VRRKFESCRGAPTGGGACHNKPPRHRNVIETLRDHPFRASPDPTYTFHAHRLTCPNSEDFTRPHICQAFEVLVGASPWGFKSPLRHPF